MITGIKGVGKSTIASIISKELGVLHMDYADFMLQIMDTKEKDAIETLSSTDRLNIIKQIRKMLEQQFIHNTERSFIVLENHLTTIQNKKINIPSLEIYWRFNMASLVVIYANPNQIISRRQLDIKRNRSEENESQIISQQKENRIQADLISRKYNVPLKCFYNDDNLIPSNEICEWIKSNMLN